ncbi:hypothetical protein AJ79_08445 [Helicocarpus griseus UAMH5409]|uniref:Fungal-type protein kinase domain-containing protein n=1 Tax=Helicocarpus griseus UAMH5409 TaxID=1447875 RepID=A0A2B7WT62_9EURO|nr:hypothetical protein AJ79_08445 [Helicocarpus griseus UAMH5409]
MIQCDISPRNLLVNEDEESPSWRAFLIDLDLAIRVERDGFSGARGKTGTRPFMAIGVLYGEKHSFMHDLESFFWVLFWICIHYDGPGKGRVVEHFEEWNYVNTKTLADEKKGVVSDEGGFLRTAEENFTPYYQPLAPWVNRLRRIVFPDGLCSGVDFELQDLPPASLLGHACFLVCRSRWWRPTAAVNDEADLQYSGDDEIVTVP